MDRGPVRPALRRCLPHPERGDSAELFCLVLRVGVSGWNLVHRFSQLGFTQHQQARPAAHAGSTVLRRLAGYIGHVDAFAESVAVDGSLRRCNPETLGEDPTVIGRAAAVPELQIVVSNTTSPRATRSLFYILDACRIS